MSKHTNRQLRSNQQGVVAIIVAVMLTIIISLLILAISQNSNREQRQALDRQLSDQAFYNAESGINDVANYLYKNINTVGFPVEEKDCLGLSGMPPTKINFTINDPSGTNKYTCLLYNKAPEELIYEKLSVATPRVVPIQTVDLAGSAPVPIDSLTISWDDSEDRSAPIAAPCDFSSGGPTLPKSCTHGGVRVELINPAQTRDDIQKQSFSAFLLPSSTALGSPLSALLDLNDPNKQGIISPTTCASPSSPTFNDARRCSKTINKISTNNLYLNIRSIYRPVNVSITGKDASGTVLRFKNTQIIVDSSAKASDVLRRVQVRIPATSQYNYPGFAVQSRDSICKVLNVTKNDNGTGQVDSADDLTCPIN